VIPAQEHQPRSDRGQKGVVARSDIGGFFIIVSCVTTRGFLEPKRLLGVDLIECAPNYIALAGHFLACCCFQTRTSAHG